MIILNMLKKILIISLTCFVVLFKAIIFPFFYLKVKLLKLDKIKPIIISTLNQFYGSDIDPSVYSFDISILPGATLSKNDDACTTLAMSNNMKSVIKFGLNIDNHKGYLKFPVILELNNSLERLSKLFNMKQMVYMYFEKGELTQIQLIIKFNKRLETHINPYHVKSRFFISIELTPSFQLIDIRTVRMDYELDMIENRRKYYNCLPAVDFFHLIYLNELKHNPFLIELLPELIIPSAYDFNSVEFNQRLLLVEMIEY